MVNISGQIPNREANCLLQYEYGHFFVLKYADLAEMKDKMVADQFGWSHAFQKTQILGAIKSLNFL